MIDDKLKGLYLNTIMDKLLNLPDEILKKENTDVLGNLISAINTIFFNVHGRSGNNALEPFFQFWFQMITKCISCSSLVTKLFGWEQLNELIAEVKYNRPPASSFTVEGAGTEYANGVYVAQPKGTETSALKYSKASTQPGVPLLTLFQCTMRNTKAKWWFISQADLEIRDLLGLPEPASMRHRF
jgi:hypothetical protein